MNAETCILVSTCDRYRPVAEWTCRLIEKHWSNHPPMQLVGVGDHRDWMTVNLAGVESVRRKGYRWVYFILDDHPPLGPCNELVLNDELPRLAAVLNAVNIGLLGWGQRREHEGEVLPRGHGGLLRSDACFRWKFSLHPALWSADSLCELLETRIGQFAVADRTPWNFERHRDSMDGPVRRELLQSCYRVNGASMSVGRGLGAGIVKQTALSAFDLLRFVIRITRGQEARNAYDSENLWLYHYYRGPYPIFWSGAMRQGVPGREFEKFLRFTGRLGMMREWSEVKLKLQPPC